MKALLSVTRQFFAQLRSDAMLVMLILLPIIMGFLFRFGVPALEGYLCTQLGRAAILAPYYFVFDLLLSIMTPYMFSAAGAMVILDEADLGLARAIAVTPVERRGYLASRIGVPAVLATLYCTAVTLVFRLSGLDAGRLIVLALCSGALGVVVALMVSSMAQNKVEGLAYSKLSGLFVLGLPVALLIPAPAQYISAVLPTFWMTKLALGASLLNALPALLASLLWAAAFARHFVKKVLT
ncbi:MAG: hypothetical protein Q4B48_07790 [Syntrophomonadaceae bacterium]|nr:hypothetical protein [Syntrophomonadaceae bacterium]